MKNTFTNEIANLKNTHENLVEALEEIVLHNDLAVGINDKIPADLIAFLRRNVDAVAFSGTKLEELNAPAKAREENAVIVQAVHDELTMIQGHIDPHATPIHNAINSITRREIQEIATKAKDAGAAHQIPFWIATLIRSKLTDGPSRVEFARTCFRIDNPTGIDHSLLGDTE